jgi:hypothetical protein
VARRLLERLTVRFCLSLLVGFQVTVVAAASGRADGLYFTEQIGGARTGGQLGDYFGGGFAGHIGLGLHLEGWAFEGSVHFDELAGRGVFAGGDYEAVAWGAGVRRLFPVSPWVRLYARGGVESVRIDQTSWGEPNLGDGYRGRGLTYGGGLMLSGRVPLLGFLFAPLFFTDIGPKVSAGAWLDVGDRLLDLHEDRASDLDGFTRTFLVGFSLGGSF